VLLTIERVALLRRADLFAETPDRVLAGLAQVLEEVEFPAGAVVMSEGAVEGWMFLIEHGEVEVIRSDRRIRMGAGAVVGELEVLDAQPRSATVVAVSPLRLLRVSKAAFEEALRLRPEIARGVITLLTRRLREIHEL
jgi:CRP/FNR family transcriptional regulator, cyclic AMP receptor protein